MHILKSVHADPHPGNFLITEKGELVAIDFGCIKEIPELIELKKKFKNNVEVYFLAVDSNVKKTVPKFLKKNKLESLLVFNDEKLEVSSIFGVKVMPTTIIINKDFEEVAQVKGYVDWLSSEYLDLIKNFL